MKCINLKHPEFINLVNTVGLNEHVVSLHATTWMEENETDNFPTTKELLEYLEQKAETSKEIKPGVGENVEIAVFEPEQIHILSSKADIQGFKDYMAFQNSEFAKYGTYEQFRQFITSKSSMEIENRLIETGKIDRVC